MIDDLLDMIFPLKKTSVHLESCWDTCQQLHQLKDTIILMCSTDFLADMF